MLRRARAFTLIELLTAIGIIVILAAIAVVSVGAAGRSAKASRCVDNLAQLGKAEALYASANDDTLPPYTAMQGVTPNDPPDHTARLEACLKPFGATEPSLWKCPLGETNWAPDTWLRMSGGHYETPGFTISLYYNQGNQFGPPHLSSVPEPAADPLLADPFFVSRGPDQPSTRSPHGERVGTALFFDGHVKLVSVDAFAIL